MHESIWLVEKVCNIHEWMNLIGWKSVQITDLNGVQLEIFYRSECH